MNPILARLERISLFGKLKNDKPALEKIAALIHSKTYPPRTYIIREGEKGNAMFILNQGTVLVEKSTLSHDRFTVANLKDDMDVFFGEMALMDDDVRSASVFAATTVECYVIRKADFEQLCETNPKIDYYVIREIAKSLAGRLRKTTTDSARLITALIHDDDESGLDEEHA
jgi:CRP/FNR family transcriptional regulator, cyclic AMP receptor protein